jgi:CheY-like chemotaxis protein
MTDSTASPHLLLVAADGSQATGCVEALAETPRYTLDEACSADDAIALAARRRPSVIVVDLHGREHTGIDMCRRFVTDEATRNVPILVITGSPHTLQFMIELTVKPCDTESLDREISRLVNCVH